MSGPFAKTTPMTSHSGTVEDERLALDAEELDTIEAIARNGQTGRVTPYEIRQLVAAYRELPALRSRPVEAGELVPVAWHNGVGQVMTPDQLAEQDEVCASRFSEALVPASSLTSLQARVEELERERDGLRRALIESGRAAGGFLADTVSSEFLSYVPTEVRALSTRLKEAEKALEAADDARTRLNNYADAANAGDAQAGGRELKRKIWGAFSDYDRARSTLKGEA